MSDKQIKSLAHKLCAIMGEVESIAKSGRNTQQNYSYVREADVSDTIRKLMSKHGVFCLPSVDEIQDHEIESKSGAKGSFVRVKVKYTFINADNPEDRLETTHYGDGSDYGDKALYKALTGGHKYMMIRTFCLGSEDDPEQAGAGDNIGAKISITRDEARGVPGRPMASGDVILFGKHKGTRWDQVNTNYLEWLSQQKEGPGKDRAILELARRAVDSPVAQDFLTDELPDWGNTNV